jgi:pyruvate dehydrogenase E1 component beta subunit
MSSLTIAKALTAGLRRAMEDDPKVILMGEDIGKLGGVFRVTEGLQKDFGEERVMDTPLAEAGIVGTAIGLALRGYRPVVEIQFDGFVYPAFDHIVSQVAKMRARSLGFVSLPMVIRIPVGGGIGAVEHHSESNEAYFAHTAGLRVVTVSNPQDAYWGIQQAIATDDPVIFYEPKRRYWDKGEVDESASTRGLFEAAVIKEGTDCTVVAYGPMVKTCLQAAQAAEDEGKSIEVVDLRSLSPLDLDTVVASVGWSSSTRRRPTSASAPRSRRRSPSERSTHWRLRSCASAATTCPTRRAGSRRSSSPTSTAFSTPSTALSPSDSRIPRQGNSPYAGPAVPTPRSRRGPHRGRDRHLAGRQGRHREGQRHRRRGRDREVPRRAAGPVRGSGDRAARQRR